MSTISSPSDWGHMGAPMSAHLAAAGHVVRGVDLNSSSPRRPPPRGVQIVRSLRGRRCGCRDHLAAQARARPRCVRGADGILAHAAPSTLAADISTVDVETSRWCHAEAQRHACARGTHRSPAAPRAREAHTLTFGAGGRAADVGAGAGGRGADGGQRDRLQEAGAGIAAKLVNNMMLFISVMAEVVEVGSRLAERARPGSAGALGRRARFVRRLVGPAHLVSGAGHRGDLAWPTRTGRDLLGGSRAQGLRTGRSSRRRHRCAPAGGASALRQLDDLIAEGLGGKDRTLVAQSSALPDGSPGGYDLSWRRQGPAA